MWRRCDRFGFYSRLILQSLSILFLQFLLMIEVLGALGGLAVKSFLKLLLTAVDVYQLSTDHRRPRRAQVTHDAGNFFRIRTAAHRHV